MHCSQRSNTRCLSAKNNFYFNTDTKMKAVWISVVVLLLSVVELEAATSAPESSCPQRILTVTVNDILRLYINGVEVTDLPNANTPYQSDVVALPCTTRLIAIYGRNEPGWGGPGILASTGDNYVLTDSSWKCLNVSNSGWEGIDFDDSSWMSAVEYGHNGKDSLSISGISRHAEWIWTRQKETDEQVYCRKIIDINECLLGFPHSECNTSMGICINFFGGYNCSCCEGYTNDGSKRCKDINECLLGIPHSECDTSMGECINFFGGYNCSCNEGYTNDGSKRCKDINECLLGIPHSECDTSMGICINFFGGYNCSCYEGYTNDGSKRCKVSTGSYSTSFTIFGVFLGVSVLANIALISALWVLHLRKKREENKDNNEGETDVGIARHTGIDPAHYEYPT